MSEESNPKFVAEVRGSKTYGKKQEEGFKPSAPSGTLRPQPVQVPEPTRPSSDKKADK